MISEEIEGNLKIPCLGLCMRFFLFSNMLPIVLFQSIS